MKYLKRSKTILLLFLIFLDLFICIMIYNVILKYNLTKQLISVSNIYLNNKISFDYNIHTMLNSYLYEIKDIINELNEEYNVEIYIGNNKDIFLKNTVYSKIIFYTNNDKLTKKINEISLNIYEIKNGEDKIEIGSIKSNKESINNTIYVFKDILDEYYGK